MIANPLKKLMRDDIPGVFNEINVIKNHPIRFYNALRKGEILPPYEVLIHPSSVCNLKCEWCIGGKVGTEVARSKAELQKLPSALMDSANMEKLIDNIVNYKKTIDIDTNSGKKRKTFGVEAVSFSGIVGEPLLAKESLKTAIKILKKHKIRIGMFSNATLLDKDTIKLMLDLDYINISIDAVNPETYAELKYGGNKEGEKVFHTLIRNINNLVRLRNSSKSKLKVNASCILYSGNYREVYNLAKKLKKIGIDTFRIKQDNSGNSLLNKKQIIVAEKQIKKIISLIDEKFNFIRVHRLNQPSEMRRHFKTCIITDLMAAVGSDGNVYPCNYHPRVGGISYGNAVETSFQDIWEGDKRKKLKKLLPSKCPKVCDPFKNRANRLYNTIKECEKKYGRDKTNGFVGEIINTISNA